MSAIAPPTRPVSTNAINNWHGPIHAPIAVQSFTSPAPIPPIQKSNPKAKTQAPLLPDSARRHASHAANLKPRPRKAKNGSTSQFGIRRLRRSVKVATTQNNHRRPPGKRVHYPCSFSRCGPGITTVIECNWLTKLFGHQILRFQIDNGFASNQVYTPVYGSSHPLECVVYTSASVPSLCACTTYRSGDPASSTRRTHVARSVQTYLRAR